MKAPLITIISISIKVLFHHNDIISQAFLPVEKSVVFSETSFNLAVWLC